MYKSIFRRKLGYLKYNYWQKAKDYFEKHYVCEKCWEQRLWCLTLHHTEWKKVDKFQTLCFNCHMIHHAGRSWEETFETDLMKDMERMKIEADKKFRIKNRNNRIIKYYEAWITTRYIAKEVGISHVSVSYIINDYKSGLISK